MSTDESDFMTQLLDNYPFVNEQDFGSTEGFSSTFWPSIEAAAYMTGGEEELLCYGSHVLNTTALGNSNPSLEHVDYYLDDFGNSLAGHCMVDGGNATSHVLVTDNPFQGFVYFNEEISGQSGEAGANPSSDDLDRARVSQIKRKFQMPESDQAIVDYNATNPCENPKKKSRGSRDVKNNGKRETYKKNQKVPRRDYEDDSNAALTAQSCSSYSEDDDSNGSYSKGSMYPNLNGKTRASRGSATDSQSLYARKRRERINERLRILQNLVPNGTKVDISTMLDEAVQYVKFLQVQIKLLSSDEMWMYAPIAYNGMDIGLDLRIQKGLMLA